MMLPDTSLVSPRSCGETPRMIAPETWLGPIASTWPWITGTTCVTPGTAFSRWTAPSRSGSSSTAPMT